MNVKSILDSIKKLLGIKPEYTNFDIDVIMHINTVLIILTQLGVGPKTGFSITDSETEWEDFLGTDKRLVLVQSFMFMKVRSMFDPPTISSVLDSMERTIKELEWRIIVMSDEIRLEEEIQNGV